GAVGGLWWRPVIESGSPDADNRRLGERCLRLTRETLLQRIAAAARSDRSGDRRQPAEARLTLAQPARLRKRLVLGVGGRREAPAADDGAMVHRKERA